MSDTYYQKLLDDEMRQKVPNWKSVKQYINLNVILHLCSSFVA